MGRGDRTRYEKKEFKDKELSRLKEAASIIRNGEKSVRVLRSVSWGPDIAHRFLAGGERVLPEVSYAPLDAAPVHECMQQARRLLEGSGVVHDWLRRIANVIDTAAEMLACVGTKDFHRHSVELYGSPQTRLLDCDLRPLDLANSLDEVLSNFSNPELTLDDTTKTLTADQISGRMSSIFSRHFGSQAPSVEVIDTLSARALAGANRVKLRRGSTFSDRDLAQLVQHEAFVHIGTSLNGKAQPHFGILAAGHAGTTRTQEGLAVFAELVSGAMDPSRMLRLADRVRAVQMSMDGANFFELYRFFLERGKGDRIEAFENTRRVVRGGLLTGGAPFTKDSVYLEGLIRVHNFLRIAGQEARIDCIRLLFCGKLDIEDLPAIATLAAEGLCSFPTFLPPWARDLRFLISYIAYSSFLNRMNLERVRMHYQDLLQNLPTVSVSGTVLRG